MVIKYFQEFDGSWLDITGNVGDTLTLTASGWVTAPKGGVVWGAITGNLTDQTDLKDKLDTKVDKNLAITGATKTKITYDAKGLVTAGADLSASDLPTGIDATKISSGSVSNTEFDYLDGVTSTIQTQLNTKGYTLTTMSLASNTTAGSTYYFGSQPRALLGTSANQRIYIPRTGTIKRAEIISYASTTAGTNQQISLSIRLNNTTDTLVANVSSATALREFINTALSISVTAGDYIEMKVVLATPFTTPPAGITFGGQIYIE
jgi:hypothetical protein